MPLGKQFQNTYFTDESGVTHTYTDRRDINAAQEARGQVPYSDRVHATPVHRDSTSSAASLAELAGIHHQGMLFSPYHGTGLRQDPSIPEETRREAIRNAYNLGDAAAYRQNFGRSDRNKMPPTAGEAEKARKLIEDTAHESNFPTHMFQQVRTGASIHNTLSTGVLGDYHSVSNQIRVKPYTETTAYEGPSTTRVIGAEAGAPIMNPNFSKVVNKKEWNSTEGAHADMAKHATFADESGRHYNMSGNWNPREMQNDNPSVDPNHFTELPAGHSANVWEGAGKDTDKYVTKTFKVYSGYNAYNNTDTYRTFHTRHERVGGVVEEVPGEMKFRKTRALDPSTLIHETGHAMDPNIGRPGWKDPIKEGIAEGISDRFFAHGHNYEEALSDPEVRAQDISKGVSSKTGGGYIAGSDRWNSWVGRNDQALHIATRVHTAMGDQNFRQIPNPDHFASVSNQPNQMVLGHLYHTHAHVRAVLDHMGFQKEGQAAAEKYRATLPDATRTPDTQHVQGELF